MLDCLGILFKCKDCDSPVFSYLCNNDFFAIRPEAVKEDYWMSCSNLTCPNHYGEGYLMDFPKWVEEDKPPECQLFPIPLSQRHPRPSDCNENGCCWLADVIDNPLRLEWYWDNTPADPAYVYWLPHDVKFLPVTCPK